ncbi:hypothetical protein ACEPAG_3060 [Sanghuangporus baumii]
MKLRDHLLDALKPLPGTRHFHLHALVSAPYKYGELFPYASARPRIYAQDILVFVSEEVDTDQSAGAEAESKSGSRSTPTESQHIFVTAIEATLFHIPATTSAILYVAKVDSTGQGKRPSPTTALVRALISFYVSPETRPTKLRGTTLWIHLFARAERQYLFPNSAEHPSKRPLNDVKLCLWWKRLLGRMVQELGQDAGDARLYYVLPGMNELEALQALGDYLKPSDTKSPKWIYGHPYSQKEIPLPYVHSAKAIEPYNLGQLIPSFDDDPKTRFIDEIACTTRVEGLHSPSRKRRRIDTDTDKKAGKEKADKETRIEGELGLVNPDEFWERMSFRQECVAGAITGFFVLVFPSPSPSRARDKSSSKPASAIREGTSTNANANALAPQPGEVSHHLVERVIRSLMTSHEFSTTERSLRATSILEASIRGLCSGGIHIHETTTTTTTTRRARAPPPFLIGDDPSTKKDQTGGEGSEDVSRQPQSQSQSQAQSLEPPKTPPPRRPIPLSQQLKNEEMDMDMDISPNPFPEPEPSADTYTSFVHGDIAISNPDAALPPPISVQNGSADMGGATGAGRGHGHGHVTVLTVRKKKRK